MFENILVVCDGNICRSPTVEFMLQARTSKNISSAGLVGLVGHDMDATAREVAEAHGLKCPPHSGRKLTRELCQQADLILVMEQRQRERVTQLAPEASGKTMLLGKWLGDKEVPDPYKRSRDVFEHVYTLMDNAVAEWTKRLG
ncbi:MAG TPA: protein tyrosine phosphatase [Alcanivoracaceae bacterium]|nr:protein tyrosine phosphatase [Alcanivoracaceae bacterium]